VLSVSLWGFYCSLW